MAAPRFQATHVIVRRDRKGRRGLLVWLPCMPPPPTHLLSGTSSAPPEAFDARAGGSYLLYAYVQEGRTRFQRQ
jgi:hypothetical protein